MEVIIKTFGFSLELAHSTIVEAIRLGAPKKYFYTRYEPYWVSPQWENSIDFRTDPYVIKTIKANNNSLVCNFSIEKIPDGAIWKLISDDSGAERVDILIDPSNKSVFEYSKNGIKCKCKSWR